jgi:hypothetical protein
MKTFVLRVVLCCGLLLISMTSNAGIANVAVCASPMAAVSCTLNQQMWLVVGSDGFGAGVHLGQTFVPSALAPVCKVTLKIHKMLPAAGALTLQIRAGGPGGPLMMTATRPAPNALGGPQIIDFNFYCAGPLVNPGQVYFLELNADTSPANSYRWDRSGNDAAYGPGHGWRKNGAAAVWMMRNYDYAFRVYLCQ